MDRMNGAIHEAGHIVACHYAGFEVTKIKQNQIEIIYPPLPSEKLPQDEPGYEGKVFPRTTYEQRVLKWLWAHIHVASAGFIAEFMYSSNIQFWTDNPKSLLMKTSDMKKLQEMTFEKKISRESVETALKGFHGFLSSPEIWGKVTVLADEVLDNKNLAKKDAVFGQQFKWVIVKSQRQRTPQYDAHPLIMFILKELYRS